VSGESIKYQKGYSPQRRRGRREKHRKTSNRKGAKEAKKSNNYFKNPEPYCHACTRRADSRLMAKLPLPAHAPYLHPCRQSTAAQHNVLIEQAANTPLPKQAGTTGF
jgi:hypothetical protein